MKNLMLSITGTIEWSILNVSHLANNQYKGYLKRKLKWRMPLSGKNIR